MSLIWDFARAFTSIWQHVYPGKGFPGGPVITCLSMLEQQETQVRSLCWEDPSTWESQDSAQINGIDSVLSKAEIASCSYEARYVGIKDVVMLNE